MANANPRLHMGTLPLTLDWQLYSAPSTCRKVELTTDQVWCYCSDKTKPETSRTIAAFTRETILDSPNLVLGQGEPLCWIKGTALGTIYEKCTR